MCDLKKGYDGEAPDSVASIVSVDQITSDTRAKLQVE
jgi:hypothetical protein